MGVILVAGSEPGAGATTLAAGIAHRLAYAGHRVRLERLDGDDHARRDAEAFALAEFAESPGRPVSEPTSEEGPVTVVEAPAAGDAAALAKRLGATLVAVGPAGLEVPADAIAFENHARRGGRLRIPEDRLLAAPSVGRIIEACEAHVLARSRSGDDAICEWIMIGPIQSDAAEPYFARYGRKAVVTRAGRVDIALAALRTDTRCLVMTGGSEPSPYLIDRVLATRDVTLLLAPEGTVETLRDIEGLFAKESFFGDEKIERIGALARDAIDDETLARLAG